MFWQSQAFPTEKSNFVWLSLICQKSQNFKVWLQKSQIGNYFLPRFNLKKTQKQLEFTGPEIWSQIPNNLKSTSFHSFTSGLHGWNVFNNTVLITITAYHLPLYQCVVIAFRILVPSVRFIFPQLCSVTLRIG